MRFGIWDMGSAFYKQHLQKQQSRHEPALLLGSFLNDLQNGSQYHPNKKETKNIVVFHRAFWSNFIKPYMLSIRYAVINRRLFYYTTLLALSPGTALNPLSAKNL